MGTKEDFVTLLNQHGSPVIFHRDDSTIVCPCVTPEGFRDPEWHDAHPTEPVCDERGYLHDPAHSTEITIKGFVQPSQSTRATRMSPEYLQEMFGEIQAGDHIGIFSESWGSTVLNFYDWSQSGEDWIKYNGRYYTVIAAHLLGAPDTGDPRHHWEIGLRLIDTPLGQ
jgi:hypothetical protein